MPKVTGLSEVEMQKLNDTLESLLHQGMAAFEPKVDTKAERVAFKGVEMALKMAEHFPLATRLGYLVDGANKVLPKLTKYFNEQAILEFVPAELKTQEIADLCEKAGAKSLADLLHAAVAAPAVPAQSASVVAAPIVASAAAASAPVTATGPKISPANLRISPTPTIPPGPGGR